MRPIIPQFKLISLKMHIYDMYEFLGLYGPHTQLFHNLLEVTEFEVIPNSFKLLMTTDKRYLEIQYKTNYQGVNYEILLKGMQYCDAELGVIRELFFTIQDEHKNFTELDYAHLSRIQETFTLSEKRKFFKRYDIDKGIDAEKKCKEYHELFEKQKARLDLTNTSALTPLQEIEKHTYILMSDLAIYDACTLTDVTCTPNNLPRSAGRIFKFDWTNGETEFELFASHLDEALRKTYDFCHPSLRSIRGFTDFGALDHYKKSNYQGVGLVCMKMTQLLPYATNLSTDGKPQQDAPLLIIPTDMLRAIVARVLNVYPETLHAHRNYALQQGNLERM